MFDGRDLRVSGWKGSARLMAAYYNENDPFVAAWLRELINAGLIADGEVDERSIELVQPDDLRGFIQCHFFAGIGGWSYALRLAGWPDDRAVWTGSCPCQKHSSATRGRATARDWAPELLELVDANRPVVFFGEQVSAARAWLDGVCDCFERLGYTFRAAVLPAYCAGFDHARERIYFAGHTHRHGQSGRAVNEETPWMSWPRSYTARMGAADGIPNIVGQMRAFGNAIVPQVAAAFIEAYCEARGEALTVDAGATDSAEGVTESA